MALTISEWPAVNPSMENPQPVATSSSSRWSSDDSVTRTAASISTDRSTKTITPNGVSQSLGASAHLSDSRDSLNAPMGQATYPVQGTMSSYNKPLKTSPSTSSFSSIYHSAPSSPLDAAVPLLPGERNIIKQITRAEMEIRPFFLCSLCENWCDISEHSFHLQASCVEVNPRTSLQRKYIPDDSDDEKPSKRRKQIDENEGVHYSTRNVAGTSKSASATRKSSGSKPSPSTSKRSTKDIKVTSTLTKSSTADSPEIIDVSY